MADTKPKLSEYQKLQNRIKHESDNDDEKEEDYVVQIDAESKNDEKNTYHVITLYFKTASNLPTNSSLHVTYNKDDNYKSKFVARDNRGQSDDGYIAFTERIYDKIVIEGSQDEIDIDFCVEGGHRADRSGTTGSANVKLPKTDYIELNQKVNIQLVNIHRDANGKTCEISVAITKYSYKNKEAYHKMLENSNRGFYVDALSFAKCLNDAIEWMKNDDNLDVILKMNQSLEKVLLKSKVSKNLLSDLCGINSNRIEDHCLEILNKYNVYYIDEDYGIQFVERSSCYKNRKINENGLKCIGIDVTEWYFVALRYVVLRFALGGQDNEFNIYRACYFTGLQNFPITVAFSIASLVLSIIFCAAVTLDVIDNLDLSEIGQGVNNQLILCLSVIIFCIIGLLSYRTIEMTVQFYERSFGLWTYSTIYWFLMSADFITNIVISIIVGFVSFFFCVKSETLGE
eukprot:363748_1